MYIGRAGSGNFGDALASFDIRWRNHLRFLGDPNIVIHRMNTGGAKYGNQFVRFGIPGQSDFTGIVKEVRCPICKGLTGAGVRLEIECKAPDGRLSELQKAWLDKIKAMNGIAIVFHPKTIDELFAMNVRKFLTKEIYKPCSQCTSKLSTA